MLVEDVSAEGRVEKQNEPKRPPLLWPFGFVLVFNSIDEKKSDPPSAENRVKIVLHISDTPVMTIMR